MTKVYKTKNGLEFIAVPELSEAYGCTGCIFDRGVVCARESLVSEDLEIEIKSMCSTKNRVYQPKDL